jgi:hypothetical protein
MHRPTINFLCNLTATLQLSMTTCKMFFPAINRELISMETDSKKKPHYTLHTFPTRLYFSYAPTLTQKRFPPQFHTQNLIFISHFFSVKYMAIPLKMSNLITMTTLGEFSAGSVLQACLQCHNLKTCIYFRPLKSALNN